MIKDVLNVMQKIRPLERRSAQRLWGDFSSVGTRGCIIHASNGNQSPENPTFLQASLLPTLENG